MDKMDTDNVKELHKKDVFTESIIHQTKRYRVISPTIPFSNIIISND